MVVGGKICCGVCMWSLLFGDDVLYVVLCLVCGLLFVLGCGLMFSV